MSAFPAEEALALHRLIGGAWSTQAIGVAAELGVADLVADGGRDAGELAARLDCDRACLERLLRALATLGLLRESAPSRFELLARGQLLRRDVPGSLGAWAIWCARYQWSRWDELRQAVREGRGRAGTRPGAPGYERLGSDPASAAVFHEAMARLTEPVAAALMAAHDFARWKRVLDVGGGQGFVAVALLEAHAHLHAAVQELPHAREAAETLFESRGVAGRCCFVARSFFDGIEPDCDVHVLKSVLHNWDDDHACALLRACVRALPADGILLIVERLMPDSVRDCPSHRDAARTDLNMLLGYGGRERTRAELRAMLDACGLALRTEKELGLGFNVLEASPRRRCEGDGRAVTSSATP